MRTLRWLNEPYLEFLLKSPAEYDIGKWVPFPSNTELRRKYMDARNRFEEEEENNWWGIPPEDRKKGLYKKKYNIRNPDKFYHLFDQYALADKDYAEAKKDRQDYNKKPKDRYLKM